MVNEFAEKLTFIKIVGAQGFARFHLVAQLIRSLVQLIGQSLIQLTREACWLSVDVQIVTFFQLAVKSSVSDDHSSRLDVDAAACSNA